MALPLIQRGLHATFSDLQWVIDGYALTLAGALLAARSLADQAGRGQLGLDGQGDRVLLRAVVDVAFQP